MKKQTLVGICTKMEPLVPREFDANDITVTIGTLEEGKETPRNWSLDYETPKASPGGLFSRIFAGNHGNIFSLYGPEISYGDLRAYEHGFHALKAVGKNMDKMHVSRGPSMDAADGMGRFLEACGVEFVFCRPVGFTTHDAWLNRGEWHKLTVGAFVARVRQNLYVQPQTAAVA